MTNVSSFSLIDRYCRRWRLCRQWCKYQLLLDIFTSRRHQIASMEPFKWHHWSPAVIVIGANGDVVHHFFSQMAP